jgi:hypothetical protein
MENLKSVDVNHVFAVYQCLMRAVGSRYNKRPTILLRYRKPAMYFQPASVELSRRPSRPIQKIRITATTEIAYPYPQGYVVDVITKRPSSWQYLSTPPSLGDQIMQ